MAVAVNNPFIVTDPVINVDPVINADPVTLNEPDTVVLPSMSSFAFCVVFPMLTFVASSYITPIESVVAPVNLAT